MSSFILGMTVAIEEAAADPGISDELKEWVLEKCVPALCAEVRRLSGLVPPTERPDPPRPEPAPVHVETPAVHETPRTVHVDPVPVHAEPLPIKPAPRDPLKSVRDLSTVRTKYPSTAVPGLRRQMAKAGLTHIQLAAKVGVSAGSIDNWRSGRVQPLTERLPELAAALGCTVEQPVTT